MTDAYKAPASNVEKDDEQTIVLRQLYKEQSYVAALLGGLIGLVPGLLLCFFIASEMSGFITLFVLLLPGAVTAGFVKFCGRAFDARVRLAPAVLTFLILATIFWIETFSPLLILIAFINAVIVMGFSRRPLTYEQ